jgi:type II secretory pathway pseudopilin PulG
MMDLMTKKNRQEEAGITLVETMVSLIIFSAVLAGLVPAYVSYRLQSIKNPVRLGAVSVSQQILDEIREVRDINALPNDGVAKTTATPSTPTLPALPALRRNTDLTNLTAYGKNYSAQVIYCETIPVDKSDYCRPNTRHIHVLVFQKFSNGSVSTNPVYEVSTIYTKLEQ